MLYDIFGRRSFLESVQSTIDKIVEHNNSEEGTNRDEIEQFADKVIVFDHCPVPDHKFFVGAADGSGDFPCVTYGDSYVYLTVANARIYEAMPNCMREIVMKDNEVVNLLWLPEDQENGKRVFVQGFSEITGESIEEVCNISDYYDLKRKRPNGVDEITSNLILPPAHDSSNIGIQLLNVAESSVLIKMMKSKDLDMCKGFPTYIIEDGTLAMPMVTAKMSLFFEITKRYACVTAKEKGFVYIALSKSHNMPRMDVIEDYILQKKGVNEHWFIRLPITNNNEPKLEFLHGRTIPPVEAVSYLFKLHKNTQAMRLDIDYKYWRENIMDEDKNTEKQREIQMFRDLDFASHDQRCYGYPYPIKACHDMASMTEYERIALRNKIIDAGVRAGLKRKNFVDAGMLTGHA